MDNKDFDKHFSEQLNQEQDFGFEEADWADLKERMEEQKGKRRPIILPFWLAAAATVFLAGIFYLWYANRMISDEVEDLHSEIAKLNEKQSTDTVYQEIIVYQKDTVFLYSNAQTPISNHPSAPEGSTTSNFSTKRATTPNPQHQKSNKLEPSAPEEHLITSNFKPQPHALSHDLSGIEGEVEGSAPEEQPITPIPIYAEAQTQMPELELLTFFIRQKPEKKRIKIDLDPGGQFNLSAGRGYAAVEQSQAENDVLGIDYGDPTIANRNAYSAGLQGELMFGEKFRITSGVNYERLKLDVENYQSFDNIPDIESAVPNLDSQTADVNVYQNASVLQQTLNYDFGLKYVFESKSKWRPYLGTAVLGQSNLKRSIEYTTNEDTSFSADQFGDLRASDSRSRPFSFYGLRTSAGTEYSISDHFGLHAEGYYNFAFKSFEDRHLSLLGVKAGIYFKF